jgi:hypothetical protein
VREAKLGMELDHTSLLLSHILPLTAEGHVFLALRGANTGSNGEEIDRMGQNREKKLI